MCSTNTTCSAPKGTYNKYLYQYNLLGTRGPRKITVVVLQAVLCTWRLTASVVNDADGVIYVKLTVKIVNYAVNRQSLVTARRYLRSLFTVPFLNDAVCAENCLHVTHLCHLKCMIMAHLVPAAVCSTNSTCSAPEGAYNKYLYQYNLLGTRGPL